MLAGAEAAKDARAEVEAEGRHFLALAVAADQITGRGLRIAGGPSVERVEADDRHEQFTAGDLELAHMLERQADLIRLVAGFASPLGR